MACNWFRRGCFSPSGPTSKHRPHQVSPRSSAGHDALTQGIHLLLDASGTRIPSNVGLDGKRCHVLNRIWPTEAKKQIGPVGHARHCKEPRPSHDQDPHRGHKFLTRHAISDPFLRSMLPFDPWTPPRLDNVRQRIEKARGLMSWGRVAVRSNTPHLGLCSKHSNSTSL